MRLVLIGPVHGRQIDRHDSVGFVHTRLAHVRGEGQVSVARLAPGGRIGRHRAASTQLLAVLEGAGTCSGSDGVEHPVSAGSAVLWEPGEEHETRSEDGLVALIVEADSLDVLTA